jgi:hypothetical protein
MRKTEDEIYMEALDDVRERLMNCKVISDLFELREYVKLEYDLDMAFDLKVWLDGFVMDEYNLNPKLEIERM